MINDEYFILRTIYDRTYGNSKFIEFEKTRLNFVTFDEKFCQDHEKILAECCTNGLCSVSFGWWYSDDEVEYRLTLDGLWKYFLYKKEYQNDTQK